MKTPSTSDLTHAQANTAYDRLAVISDHMPMLHELCDFIFDLQDWLKANQHKFLQEFVDNMNSELEVVKARLESLALTHDMDKISLQNAINSINSSITNLNNLINQVDNKTTSLLIHNLNPNDDTHGVTCKAIADYVSSRIDILTGNLGSVSTSLEDILNRISSLEARVTELEKNQSSGSVGSSTGYFDYEIGQGLAYKTTGSSSESHLGIHDVDSAYTHFNITEKSDSAGNYGKLGDPATPGWVYPYKNLITGEDGNVYVPIAHVFFFYVTRISQGGTETGGEYGKYQLFTVFFKNQPPGTGYQWVKNQCDTWIDNYVNNVIPTLPTGVGNYHGYKVVKGY